MAETPDASTQPSDDGADEALKKKLLSRIAVAGVLIVALVAALAVLDAVNNPAPKEPAIQTAALPPEPAKPEAEPKAEEKPAEKAEEKTEEKPEEKQAEKPAEPAPAEEKKEEPKTAAAPEGTSAAGTAPRPPRPLTAPATARPTLARPGEPVTQPPRTVDAQREIARTSPQPAPAYRHAPASRPLSQAVERTRQFMVQLGVFNNVANAEEMRAKLELAGIPAHIEARVQVGPFATRQEAEAAREKLRTLGMDEGILTAVRR